MKAKYLLDLFVMMGNSHIFSTFGQGQLLCMDILC